MSSSSTLLSKDEWKTRLEPALSESMQDVSERITSARSVQLWLHDASYEAAQDLARQSDLQAQAMAHRRMMDDFEETFGALIEAVHDLTEGCGTIELNWRPLAPNYSKLYIDFGRDFTADVFVRLSECTPDEAKRALDTVQAALPKGEPFPNRPNVATGLIAHAGQCVGLQVYDRIGDNRRRWRSVTLLPKEREPIENVRLDQAPRRLLKLLA